MATKKQLEIFFSDKIHNPCPRCGHRSFSIVTETDETPVDFAILSHKEDAIFTSPYMSCYMVTCDNCGYIDLFSRAFINQKIQATGEDHK